MRARGAEARVREEAAHERVREDVGVDVGFGGAWVGVEEGEGFRVAGRVSEMLDGAVFGEGGDADAKGCTGEGEEREAEGVAGEGPPRGRRGEFRGFGGRWWRRRRGGLRRSALRCYVVTNSIQSTN